MNDSGTATRLEERLGIYDELLVQMLNEVANALHLAVDAVGKRDEELAHQVVSHDRFINTLRDRGEREGVLLLVSERPYAHFLRKTITNLKAVGEIERMGDYASHLAKIGSTLLHSKEVDFIVSRVCEMALNGADMCRQATEAIQSESGGSARMVAKMDDTLDIKRDEINSLLYDFQATSPEERVALYQCYYLAKEMERLGDHATNVCEWLVFSAEGERPKLN